MKKTTLNDHFEIFFISYKEKYEETTEKKLRIIISYDDKINKASNNYKTYSCTLNIYAYKLITEHSELIQISFYDLFKSLILKMLEQTDMIYIIKNIYFEMDEFSHEYKLVCECLKIEDHINKIVVEWK